MERRGDAPTCPAGLDPAVAGESAFGCPRAGPRDRDPSRRRPCRRYRASPVMAHVRVPGRTPPVRQRRSWSRRCCSRPQTRRPCLRAPSRSWPARWLRSPQDPGGRSSPSAWPRGTYPLLQCHLKRHVGLHDREFRPPPRRPRRFPRLAERDRLSPPGAVESWDVETPRSLAASASAATGAGRAPRRRRPSPWPGWLSPLRAAPSRRRDSAPSLRPRPIESRRAP